MSRDDLEDELSDLRAYTCAYHNDEPGTWGYKYALDLISSSSIHIKNFHRDSLNLSTEYCFIFPTKGCYYDDSAAQIIGIDRSSRKKVWALSVSRCYYEKEAHWEECCSEVYKASIKVFSTKEEAIIHADLLGLQQPQVFDDFKLPSYVKRLLRFIKGVGGAWVHPAEVYRCMVLDGVMQPIKKFIKKKVA